MKRMTVKPALREDYLEAVCLYLRDTSHLPTVEGLASALGRPVTAVADDVRALASEGYLHIGENNAIALTPSGKELGMRVIKKHETLQCFLSEMLGMDSTSASSEACVLEHAISDETIDRLGNFLKIPEETSRGGQDTACPMQCPLNALTDFEEGDSLTVSRILGQDRAQRLLDLGVVPGERIRIKRKLANHTVVVQVKGCDVALSPEVAASICVERCR